MLPLLVVGSPVLAEPLTDDQRRLIGFMARTKCIAERDGHSEQWEAWQRIEFMRKGIGNGFYNEKMTIFSVQPSVFVVVNKMKYAFQEKGCNGYNPQSQAWINAVRMTLLLNKDGSHKPGFFDHY